MYPSTVAASKNGRHVLALVPRAVGFIYAKVNEETKIALQVKTSMLEKGEGLPMGSAGIILVFTIFLTVNAVYPATESEANQPPTAESKKTVRLCYPERILNTP